MPAKVRPAPLPIFACSGHLEKMAGTGQASIAGA
jgi:hypothetical protein